MGNSDRESAGSLISPAEFLELLQEGVPFSRYLHLEVEALVRGEAKLRMPYHPDVLRPGGTISGPALMTLADSAMYAVVLSAIGRVEMAVTTSMNINFLYRPPQADVLAYGKLLKLGRRLAVVQVELLSDAHSEPVAHVTGTYSIPPGPRA